MKLTFTHIFVAFIAGGFAAWLFLPRTVEYIREPHEIIKIERDTVTREIRHNPLIISAKPEIVYLRDTLILTPPFIAKVDTVLIRDTINASYIFPENLFSLELRRDADTLNFEQLRIIEQTPCRREWWETPALIISGAALGYLIGNSK